MFAIKQWLVIEPENQVRERLYSSITDPHQWRRGQGEEEARQMARERWQPKESYWLMQPGMRTLL